MAFSQRFGQAGGLGGKGLGGKGGGAFEEEARRKEYEYEKARQETIARSKKEAAKRAMGGGGFAPAGGKGGGGFGGGYGGGAAENKFAWKKSEPAPATSGKGGGKGGKAVYEDMPSHDECEMAISAMISRTGNGMKEGLEQLGLPNYPLHFVPGQELRLCGHNLREEINEMIHAWMTDEKEDFYSCLHRVRGICENPILSEEEMEMMEKKEEWERSVGADGKAVYTRRDPNKPALAALAADGGAPAAAPAAAGGLDAESSDDEVIDVTPTGAPIQDRPAVAKPAAPPAAAAADPAEDLYGLLGVDPAAPLNVLRSAFRALVIKHHPEKGGDPTEFAKLNRAYATLSDTQKRAEYDESRK